MQTDSMVSICDGPPSTTSRHRRHTMRRGTAFSNASKYSRQSLRQPQLKRDVNGLELQSDCLKEVKQSLEQSMDLYRSRNQRLRASISEVLSRSQQKRQLYVMSPNLISDFSICNATKDLLISVCDNVELFIINFRETMVRAQKQAELLASVDKELKAAQEVFEQARQNTLSAAKNAISIKAERNEQDRKAKQEYTALLAQAQNQSKLLEKVTLEQETVEAQLISLRAKLREAEQQLRRLEEGPNWGAVRLRELAVLKVAEEVLQGQLHAANVAVLRLGRV